MTTTQEILRAAATIVDNNWSAKDDALDANGKPAECVTVLGWGCVTNSRVGRSSVINNLSPSPLSAKACD